VTATLFTNDGKWLATCGAGREPAVRLWNLTSRDASDSLLLGGVDGPIRAAAVSADSRYFLAGGDDRLLRVWELAGVTADTKPTILAAGAGTITAVAVSKSGDWLAASDSQGKVFLWRVGSAGVEPQAVVLAGSERAITSLAFAPDGRWLAAAGDDWTARLWNLDVGGLASQAESLAKAQLEAVQVADQSQILDAIAAIDPEELASSTTPGIIWSAVQWHAPKVRAGWENWLKKHVATPVEPQIATGPRSNEVGAVEMPQADAIEAMAPPVTPTASERPSLTVAMPETDPAALRPTIQHEWPMRSIVKRPGQGDEPRTAAKPSSTLEIHTR
jgi:hypothetical protein